MTLLVEEEGQLTSTEDISELGTKVPGKWKISYRRGYRKSIIVIIVSATVSVLLFLASLTVLIYVVNVLKTPPPGSNQQGGIVASTQSGGVSQTNSLPWDFPLSSLVLNRTCLEDEQEILRWESYRNQTYSRGGLQYSDGFFEIPRSGFYDLHSTLSFETYLQEGMGDIKIYNCLVTSSGVTLRCNRMRHKKGWAGHSEILVLSRWLEKGEKIGATLTPTTSKSLLHGNPTENVFEIRLVR